MLSRTPLASRRGACGVLMTVTYHDSSAVFRRGLSALICFGTTPERIL